jgi:hypothetical protein
MKLHSSYCEHYRIPAADKDLGMRLASGCWPIRLTISQMKAEKEKDGAEAVLEL